MNTARTLALGLLCTTLPLAAQAQETGSFPAERLRPAMDREGLIDVEWGGLPGHLEYDLALWGGYALNPLVLYRRDDAGNLQRVGSLVGHRVGASLVGAISLFEWVELGVELPLVLYQGRGGEFEPDDASLDQLDALGIGDLALRPKIRVLRTADQHLDLAFIPALTLPSGYPRGAYLGEESFTFAPELVLSRAFGPARLAANLGYRWRPDTRFVDLDVGPELFWRAGFGFDLREVSSYPILLAASINGATAATAPFSAVNRSPLELMTGVTYDLLPALQVFGGAGFGLSAGYATPDLRVFAGVRWSPRFFDRDGDGVGDAEDRCPSDPEDRDGFEDADGCPDLDNDKDTVADTRDRCPDVAGDPAEHGCPPGDRDGDGVVDEEDSCPDQRGVPSLQGCPDRDGDGVGDAEDACPDEPGLAEHQGCPLRDRDGDGLTDDQDACPDQPGPAVFKGCPDRDGDGVPDSDDPCPEVPGPRIFKGCPDTDGDGIPDSTDQCPLEPETINGINDDDGCPDKGRPKVTVTSKSIEIGDKVYFDVDKATIKKRSHSLLKQVALTLKANPQIEKISIEGHTDAQGPADYNRELSQSRAEAVRDFLIAEGMEAERLTAKGFGEDKPVASNKTVRGRVKNRRVEFNIVGGD